MNRLQRILERVKTDLDSLGATWCLAGGLAVSVWGEPRLTRDIDVVVAVSSDRQAEELIQRLQNIGYRAEELVEQESVGRLATVRFSIDEVRNGIVLDLLFASSGIETEAAASALSVEVFEHVTVPVASRASLIVMKLLARDDRSRPMDADDLRSLISQASDPELGDARRLAALVTERGYNRGRPLLKLLEDALPTR